MKPDDRSQNVNPKTEVKTPEQRLPRTLETAHAIPVKKALDVVMRAGASPIRIGSRLDIFA